MKYLVWFSASFLFVVLGEILRRQTIREERERKAWLSAVEREHLHD